MKILGWWTAPDGSLTYHLSKIKGLVCKKIQELKPYLNFMPLKMRREMIYSRALSIPAYGLQLFLGQTESVKDKLTALYMRGNRAIHNGFIALDTKNEWIQKQVGVKSPRQLVIQEALKTIHKIVNFQSPPQLYKLIRFPRIFRKAASITIKDPPRTIRCR